MDVFRGLLHHLPDAAAGEAAAAHRALLDRPDGWVVGPLVVPDERLTGLPDDVAVSVRVGGGAGGVAALARRAGPLHLVGVESVLRDLDDLAGNAARVVAAAADLPEGVDVAVAAAGLLGRVSLAQAPGTGGAGAQLSVLVEADLPFKVTGLGTDPFGPYGVVAVLMAVAVLVDGADPREADALLREVDEHRATMALAAWDAATAGRVRRRLRGVDVVDVAATLDRLAEAGLLGPDATVAGA
jgi:hypothetical protein